MAVMARWVAGAVLGAGSLAVGVGPARAGLVVMSAGGTISSNSGYSAIPVGTPWGFEVTYDTAAPDMDFLTTGVPDPTYGQYTNTGVPAALRAFHYKAGSYEVTIDSAAGFSTGSAMLITFSSVNAIDLNVFAPALFPQLGGGAVSFHADFNAFSKAPIFTSDGLPTDTGITAGSFDESTVSLLPGSGAISGGVTRFAIMPVPEPWTGVMVGVGVMGLLLRRGARRAG